MRRWERRQRGTRSRLVRAQANGLVQKALLDKDASDTDVDCAPRLLDVILQCCKGRVDTCLPSYIELCHQRSAAMSLLRHSPSSSMLTTILDGAVPSGLGSCLQAACCQLYHAHCLL